MAMTERFRDVKKGLGREIVLALLAGILIILSLLFEHVFDVSPLFFVATYPITPQMVASLLSLSFTGAPIIWGSIKGLLRRETNVDELVSLAIIGAVILGEYNAAAIVAFIMVLGSLLEEHASGRSRRDIEAIAAKHPTHAFVQRGSQFVAVPLEQVVVGDRVLVRPGDIVPVDGRVELGESRVDESSLTGESIPVDKVTGDAVYTGTTNQDGALQVEALKMGEDSTFGKIVHLIKEAEDQRVPTRRIVDQFVRWYTPVVLVIAGVIWLATGDIFRPITILVVACPCALVLATPSAVLSALAYAARQGILIKGGRFLEACSDIDIVALDKTGTLTTGQLIVKGIFPLKGNGEVDILALAAKAEAGSEHPIAKAILNAALAHGLDVSFNGQMQTHLGLGIKGVDSDQHIAVGSRRFFERIGLSIPEEAKSAEAAIFASGKTPLFVARGKEVEGLISIEDHIRPESCTVVKQLQEEIDRVVMLTGDSGEVAQVVARQCGIPPHTVSAELLPDQKQEYLRNLQNEGRHVCYVGDGTNDGPALAQADIGVSIGTREDTIALDTAHVVLMQQGLENLPLFLALGLRTERTININLIFAISFGFTMMALAATGILTPILGAISHNIGSLMVILNSARLIKFKF